MFSFSLFINNTAATGSASPTYMHYNMHYNLYKQFQHTIQIVSIE